MSQLIVPLFVKVTPAIMAPEDPVLEKAVVPKLVVGTCRIPPFLTIRFPSLLIITVPVPNSGL